MHFQSIDSPIVLFARLTPRESRTVLGHETPFLSFSERTQSSLLISSVILCFEFEISLANVPL